MKRIAYILGLLVFMAACDRSDPGGPIDITGGGGSGLGNHEAANERILELNDKYQVQFKYVFDESELSYNWTETIDMTMMPTTPADPEYIEAYLDFLDESVLSAFPDGLIRKALPPIILLVSTCEVSYSERNEPPLGTVTKYWPMHGFVTSNVLILSKVSSEFTPDRETREALVSLFVERMQANTGLFPPPEDFYAVVGPGNWLSPGYWSGKLADSHFEWDYNPETLERGLIWQWKKTWFKLSKRAIIYHYLNQVPTTYTLIKPTQGQDVGDYYAFLALNTPAEQETILADMYGQMVETNPLGAYDTMNPDDSIAKIREKIRLIKAYFNQYYGTNF